MKILSIQLINILLLLCLIDLNKNRYINDISFKEVINNKKIYDKSELIKNNILNYNPKQKLYFSENNNKYFEFSDISNSSINYKDIIKNSSFYEIPENLISQYEKKYQREKISKIIRTIESNKNNFNYLNQNNFNHHNKKDHKCNYVNNTSNNNNEFFSDEYNFYGNKKLLNFDYNYYWNKLISQNSIINELSTSPIKELISTEPEQIYLEQKICFPISKLFYINNPDSEDNLLIKDIKSDLHQVKIFPYLPEDYTKTKGSYSSSINSYFPYSIFPQSKFVFQLLILPDIPEKITGNLYIKFNDKKVLIIPITIIGIENEYKIKPIYYMNWQINKKLILPIKITNPNKKKLLIIKEIIHSFKKINIEWPNGAKVANNYTSFIPSMFHVWPKDSKIIFYLKYISEVATNEYGFIHLKTDDNTLIVIPVLINIKNYSLNTFPGFINFGLCELSPYNRKNFVKMVPLLIMNYGNQDIEVKRIYIDYDDKFLHFHRNTKNGNQIIVKRNTHNKFGYLIFDGEYDINKDEKKYNGKIQRGTIYIETNSTIDPLLEIDYFYLTDYNKIIKQYSSDVHTISRKNSNYNFQMLFKYQPPIGFKSFNHLLDDMTIFKENFLNVNITKVYKDNYHDNINDNSHLFKINFELKNLEHFYRRYIYIPLMINSRLYTIFPIEIDNNNVDLAFCNSYSNDISFPLCIQNYGGFDKYNNYKIQYLLISTQFHFGSISGEINRKKYVYIINDNCSPVEINEIQTNNRHFTLDLEGYYSIDRNKSITTYDYSLKGKLPELIKKFNQNQRNNHNNLNLNLTIYPKTALLLSVNIQSKNTKNKTLLEGDIYLSFNNKSGVTISTKVNILIGDFSISPSNIKFEPAFPGLDQSKIIFCRNTYKVPLDIISVSSTDDRIVPILLTNKVETGKKTSIIEILFKPDMNSLIKDYKRELDMKKSLTYRELYLWKKNEEYWNNLGQNGKTEINANITVVTSLKTKIINVRSFLIKPNLVKKEEIDYGLIQVGQLVEKYIEGYNPSDSVLEMKIYLAPDYYNDIHNYSMFNLKEQQELYLDKNNIILILGCSFIVNQNNSFKNFFEYIIINENINLDNNYKNQNTKEELLKKLFFYGNSKVKKYLYNSVNVLCKYEKQYKDVFSLNKNDENKHLMSEIFSTEFNNEIEVIKNMTVNKDYNSKNYNQSGSIFGIIFKIFSKIFNYFIYKKEYFPNIQLQENKQSFYLQENLSKNIYRIQPHQKFTIGPIIFKPNNTGKVTNVLFLKNNLTILYPIKLKGEGGNGQITFNYYKNMKSKKTDIFNNTNFIIEINRDIYVNKMKYQNNLTRTITISNSGNLPLIIKNVTIDNNECQTDDLKILQCKEFLLDIGDSIDINFEITTNFGNYITNRVVKFNTDYQTYELNVIIIISKDLYEQKILYWKISKIASLIFIPFLISTFILKKIFIVNKKNNKIEINKINNNFIENRQINNNEKIFNEHETKKSYGKKKGKNKKNKKYEKIEKEKEIDNKKYDNNNVIVDKYFKKSGINNNSVGGKKEKSEIINKNKTFGVIRLNKENNNDNNNENNNEKEKNYLSNIIDINKIKEKSESKDKKTNKKKIQKVVDNKNENNNENSALKRNNSNSNEKIISKSHEIIKKDNNINNNLNNNIKNIINSNSNISNNINIKININLNSKVEDNDSFSNYNSNIEKNNTKVIEANIIHKNTSNTNNNNYNYDIKINENNSKSSSSTTNIKVNSKNRQANKKIKTKKVSNLNELLGVTTKKKPSINKKSTENDKIKKYDAKEDNINIDSFEQDIFNNMSNNKNESKKDDEKSLNNSINNECIYDKDNMINKNEEEQKETNLNEDDFDFNFASTDFFNTIFKNDIKGDNNDENNEEDDFNSYAPFGKEFLNSLYENPFCTKEKKGNLDELLKK